MAKHKCKDCGAMFDFDDVAREFEHEFGYTYVDMFGSDNYCLDCAKDKMADFDDGPQKQGCCEGCWGKWPECASTCLQYDPD